MNQLAILDKIFETLVPGASSDFKTEMGGTNQEIFSRMIKSRMQEQKLAQFPFVAIFYAPNVPGWLITRVNIEFNYYDRNELKLYSLQKAIFKELDSKQLKISGVGNYQLEWQIGYADQPVVSNVFKWTDRYVMSLVIR